MLGDYDVGGEVGTLRSIPCSLGFSTEKEQDDDILCGVLERPEAVNSLDDANGQLVIVLDVVTETF